MAVFNCKVWSKQFKHIYYGWLRQTCSDILHKSWPSGGAVAGKMELMRALNIILTVDSSVAASWSVWCGLLTCCALCWCGWQAPSPTFHFLHSVFFNVRAVSLLTCYLPSQSVMSHCSFKSSSARVSSACPVWWRSLRIFLTCGCDTGHTLPFRVPWLRS